MIRAPCWRDESRAQADLRVFALAVGGHKRARPADAFQRAPDFRGEDDRDGQQQRGQSGAHQPGEGWQFHHGGQQCQQHQQRDGAA